ncbi:MAG: SdpI family protein [Candidatus Kapabacteria bacterium]|nr:SdpI family protein [Candidatus Kapabacteria bacterium]
MDNEYIWILRILPALPGVIFIVTGYITLKFPPKSVNWWYGYRTTNSMRSQEIWEYAQHYSSVEFMRLGGIQAILGILVGFTVANEIFPVAYLLVSCIACAIAGFIRTESELRNKFPEAH